jgi:exopolysaccharide production protein ExoZ
LTSTNPPEDAWLGRIRQQINVLQYGRAIAALSVVAHHSTLATTGFGQAISPHWIEAISLRGYLGVDFFFVLSGFIITYAHMNDASGWFAARRYISKRLIRVYIPY